VNAPTRSVYERLHRATELLANIGIIVVALLGGTLLVRQLSRPAPGPFAVTRTPSQAAVPTLGTVLTLPGVDLAAAERTLVLVLSTECHFCTDSAPFYQRLATAASRARGVRLVAVLPQAAQDGRRYLARLGVTVNDVVQAPLTAVGTRGTPTLLLLDGRGAVGRVWRGRLSPEVEQQVLDAITPTMARAGGVP
jgi:hypothetical protein